MMTFEKVLEVFKDYLTEDTNCEVVLTKHGYTVMQWDENSKSWYGVEYCETPEEMWEELLSSFRMNEAQKLTEVKRELSAEDNVLLDDMCSKFVRILNN